MWNAFIGALADSLALLSGAISSVGIPYSFGFAIILLTVIIRVLTFPLNWQQIQSSRKMQALQPQLAALQKKYGKNREKLSQEQMKLYREAGINPLGGCLPMLIQFPIWIGLYQALYQLAEKGVLGSFLWIPDLGFPSQGVHFSWVWTGRYLDPVTQAPQTMSWLMVAAYLVLPILTVVSQIVVQKMMTTPSSDPQQSAMNQMMLFMPLMFGFFALQVPSGLTLYWVTSNLLQLIQQYFTGDSLGFRLRPSQVQGGGKDAQKK